MSIKPRSPEDPVAPLPRNQWGPVQVTSPSSPWQTRGTRSCHKIVVAPSKCAYFFTNLDLFRLRLRRGRCSFESCRGHAVRWTQPIDWGNCTRQTRPPLRAAPPPMRMNAEGRSWVVQTWQTGLRCLLRLERLCRADTACRPVNSRNEGCYYSTKKVIFCDSRSTPASVRIFCSSGLLIASCIFSMDSISITWYTLESSSLSWP